MRDWSVRKFEVAAELLAVSTYDQSSLVAEKVALAITFQFEDPLGWNRPTTACDGADHDYFPYLVVLQGSKLFLDSGKPLG